MKFYIGVTDNSWYYYLVGLKPEENNLNAKLAKSQTDYTDKSFASEARKEKNDYSLRSLPIEIVKTSLRSSRLNTLGAS